MIHVDCVCSVGQSVSTAGPWKSFSGLPALWHERVRQALGPTPKRAIPKGCGGVNVPGNSIRHEHINPKRSLGVLEVNAGQKITETGGNMARTGVLW